MDKEQVTSLIEKLGGTSKTAKIFNIEPQAVSQWKRKGIPSSRMMYLKLLRPDLFCSTGNNRKKAA